MLEGLISKALNFMIHYKTMFSTFSNKHKFQSQKGETLLIKTDLSRLNTVVPKSIKWKDVTLSKDWIFERVTQLKPLQPSQSNI